MVVVDLPFKNIHGNDRGKDAYLSSMLLSY